MRNLFSRFGYALGGVGAVALGFAGVASATADANMTSTAASITAYFTDNIGVVIGVVIGISVFVWLLRVLFHSVGVRKVKSID